MGKCIICRCEDVTKEDFERAYKKGFKDMESLRRYTGFGTGFCQGKSCVAHAMTLFTSLRGNQSSGDLPTRTRPLLHPTFTSCFIDKNTQGQKQTSDPKESQ